MIRLLCAGFRLVLLACIYSRRILSSLIERIFLIGFIFFIGFFKFVRAKKIHYVDSESVALG